MATVVELFNEAYRDLAAGRINETSFREQLRGLGYDDDDIRLICKRARRARDGSFHVNRFADDKP